jgi:hypothetical protein
LDASVVRCLLGYELVVNPPVRVLRPALSFRP